MDLRELIEYKAQKNGDKPLILYKDTTVSYTELDRMANRVANVLHARGIRQGDRVAIMLWNSPVFFAVWFGLIKIGAWAAFLNPHYKGATLEHLVKGIEPAAAFVASDILENFRALESSAGVPVIVQDSLGSLDDFLRDAPDTPPGAVSLGPGHIAGLVTSSGTTGLPKYLMLSHDYYRYYGMLRIHELGINPSDCIYLTMPLHHAHKLLLAAILMDARLLLAPRFSVSGFWEEVRRHTATVLVVHDQPFVMLLKAQASSRDRDHPARVVRPGFRLQRQFHERFGVAVTSVYANTEANSIAQAPWYRPYIDPHYYDTESPGLEIMQEYYDVGIVDDDDRHLPPGEVGEIVSRQKRPHVMFEGYYRDPAKTVEAFRNQWFHHGDLGMIDGRGMLHFKGRKAHSIRHRGEFIPHEAIENAANEHVKIAASALVGVPSDLGDEDLKMYVVAKEGMDLSPAELLDFLGDRVAYSMVPRYVEFVPDLPRNPGLDKVNWLELRKRGIGSAWDRERAGYKVKRS